MTTSLDVGWATGVFLLDNIAAIDDTGLRILDRRVYPHQISWVTCPDVESVATAIRNMVTQSAGTAVVGGYAMVLAAAEASAHPDPRGQLARLASVLTRTRPTNDSLAMVVDAALNACSECPPERWVATVSALFTRREAARAQTADRIGEHGARLLPDGVRLLTHCWAETGLTQMVLAATGQGHSVTVYCDETRPYLQGARLTADALQDAGATVAVIPDAAAGYLITEGAVDLVVTGSDRVTADGGVVNKAGTLALALLCERAAIPFYALSPRIDTGTPTAAGVPIELRPGSEALHCLGQRTAATGVQGFYPAFDRTPPELITGLITPDGITSPAQLKEV